MTYDRQAASALRMLMRKGVTVPLSRVVPGTKDAVNQTSTPAATATQSIVVVILPASVSRDMDFDARAMVRKNQRLLYIAGRKSDGSALDFEPENAQTVVFENATWTLGSVSRLGPDGGAPVLFTAEARR